LEDEVDGVVDFGCAGLVKDVEYANTSSRSESSWNGSRK